MILHKREEKLSSGSSYGVFNNMQDDLTCVRRVGQNDLLPPLAQQPKGEKGTSSPKGTPSPKGTSSPLGTPYSKKENKVAFAFSSSPLGPALPNPVVAFPHGGKKQKQVSRGPKENQRPQALTPLFFKGRTNKKKKKILLTAKKGVRSLFGFSSFPFTPFSSSHFFIRNPIKNKEESDFSGLRKNIFRSLVLHHNQNENKNKHKNWGVELRRGANRKNVIGTFASFQPLLSDFHKRSTSALFPTKANLFRLEKAQSSFKIPQLTIANQKGSLIVNNGGSVPPSYFGGKYSYGKDSKAGVYFASCLCCPPFPPLVSTQEGEATRRQVGVIFKRKTKRTASLTKIKKMEKGLLLYTAKEKSASSLNRNSYDFKIAFQNRLIPREYSLETFHRSNQDTCLLHNPAVSEGDWVQSGDLLADCAASSGGELSLGKNILVAYMPWEGYNFEDAILISERLVFEDVYSSIHIERYDIEIRETKYGMETITRNIPELNEKELEHLDSNGVAKLGSWIQEGDVLVGRVTPINKKIQSTYKNLLFTILQTKPESVRDSSLRAPRGMKGKIVNVQRFAHQGELEPPHGLRSKDEVIPLPILKGKVAGSNLSNDPELRSGFGTEEAQINIVYVYLAEKRKIQVGDKMAGRHGNKGIVSQVLPRQDMPFLANGTPIDMVLNPLGVPSRMNVGQIYECLLGLAAKYLGEHYKIFPFDEKYGPEASRSFVYSKLYEARKKTGSEWLFNPNCPGKTRLFDGRTGDPFDQSVTVGYAYMLKLVHLVDDKIHMRSTGPYSLVTQQPLRGRSKQGGQRLGEMEVWALEGYGAAFTLLEMLTIKSDDMTGRMTLWSNLILNKDLSIGTPESFKVLVCELQALCLDIGIFRVDSVGNLAEIESLTELP